MRNEQACFHPFCSCGTSAGCDLPIANGGGSMSWQHSLSPQCSIKGIKSSLLKLRGDPVATPASLFLHPSNSLPMLICPNPDSLQYCCSCGQCRDFLLFCWQSGDKVASVIPSPWVPGLFGKSTAPLLRVSQCHWNNLPRAVRGWGWQQCSLACSMVAACLRGGRLRLVASQASSQG